MSFNLQYAALNPLKKSLLLLLLLLPGPFAAAENAKSVSEAIRDFFCLFKECPPSAEKAESIAEAIRIEATRPNQSPEGRPLPLASHWATGRHERAKGWRPEYQIQLIEQGHHFLPGFAHPLPETKFTKKTIQELKDFVEYYQGPIKRARELKLPLVFIASQWEKGLSAASYIDLPADKNPNVIDLKGKVLDRVSPFGPVAPWRELGKKWTASPQMKKLQEWYPDPPLVIFLSNNEHRKLKWTQVEESKRYLDQYGKGKDDDFKRKIVAEGWIKRYRALQQGMQDGLDNPAWKKNVRFVGYNAFGSPHLGRWSGWPQYSLHSTGRISPYPLMWDGGSVSYYTSNWNPSTDYKVRSPQIEFMNLVFMQEEAYRLNPNFWLEMSVWDGHAPGKADDKRVEYKKRGQSFTPERYQGFVQFGMWLLRPRAVREFRGWTYRGEEGKPYFMALLEAVDLVHKNPELKKWWRRGELVPNRAHGHVYQKSIPKEYKNVDRWFLLNVDVNPQKFPWSLSDEIKVFSLALTQGKAPDRQWLVYAYSPLGNREAVRITIPEFKDVVVDVSMGGSFYLLSESTKKVRRINIKS